MIPVKVEWYSGYRSKLDYSGLQEEEGTLVHELQSKPLKSVRIYIDVYVRINFVVRLQFSRMHQSVHIYIYMYIVTKALTPCLQLTSKYLALEMSIDLWAYIKTYRLAKP